MVKNLSTNAGDVRDEDAISGSGRSPGRGHGNPPQYSCLENHMDRGACQATVQRIIKRKHSEIITYIYFKIHWVWKKRLDGKKAHELEA